MIMRSDFVSGTAPNYPDMTVLDREGKEGTVISVDLVAACAMVRLTNGDEVSRRFDDLSWPER